MTTSVQANPSASVDRKFAVLLLAHGTPDTVEEIPEYLKNVVSGRAMPQHVVEEIQSRYAQIGKSPLTEWTLKQGGVAAAENWIACVCRHAKLETLYRRHGAADAGGWSDGCGGDLPGAAKLPHQRGTVSTGSVRRSGERISISLYRCVGRSSSTGGCVCRSFATDLERSLRFGWGKVPVLFTAHSVPCRTIQVAAAAGQSSHSHSDAKPKGGEDSPAASSSGPVRPTVEERSYALPPGASSGPDPYAIETKHTAALVAERLLPDGLTSRDWYFAFQSQGMSGGPWIGPTVEETLECLHREGHRGVVLQPIGFLCDHVEILYDIDIAFQATARKLGLKLFRPESLNASPLLIAALADLSSQGLLQLGAAQIEGSPVAVASNQK